MILDIFFEMLIFTENRVKSDIFGKSGKERFFQSDLKITGFSLYLILDIFGQMRNKKKRSKKVRFLEC